jgi:ankyrin repeat protein
LNILASESGHLETVELLIKNGADKNDSTNYRFTPLHEAAKHGFKDIVELLINKGANINDKSSNKITALHYGMNFVEGGF